MISAFTLITAIIAAPPAPPQPYKSWVEVGIHQVETGGKSGPIKGDGGRALGPLQIHRAAWEDVKLPGEQYSQVATLEYALIVHRRYMTRYCTERRLGRKPTDQDRARMWNGGPNGHRKSATLKYWDKVEKAMEEAQR